MNLCFAWIFSLFPLKAAPNRKKQMCETNKHVTTSEQAAVHTETTAVPLGMKRRNVLVFYLMPKFF